MSIYCVNPSVYQGDPGDPPEFSSDNEVACAECHVFLDLDDEPHTEMDDGSVLCEDCRKMCSGSCGEWLTDLKTAIRLRCLATGRIEIWCAFCAAEEWVERLIEFAADNDFFPPWPISGFPWRGVNQHPYASELDKEAVQELYKFYRKESPCLI